MCSTYIQRNANGAVMRYKALPSYVGMVALLAAHVGYGQAQSYSLESARGLKLHGVVAQAATLDGKKGLRVEPDSISRAASSEPDMLASIDGLQFSNGVIEAEIAGT